MKKLMNETKHEDIIKSDGIIDKVNDMLEQCEIQKKMREDININD